MAWTWQCSIATSVHGWYFHILHFCLTFFYVIWYTWTKCDRLKNPLNLHIMKRPWYAQWLEDLTFDVTSQCNTTTVNWSSSWPLPFWFHIAWWLQNVYPTARIPEYPPEEAPLVICWMGLGVFISVPLYPSLRTAVKGPQNDGPKGKCGLRL